MSTATVPMIIVCPDWCTVDPQEHADSLWDSEGHCFHYAPETVVADVTQGPGVGPLENPIPAPPVHVYFTTSTNPEGRESAPPTFFVNDRECSLEQALALADVIKESVRAYRSTGGVA